MMKYSRLIILLVISFACVAINFMLVATGHYRAPLFVFLASIFVAVLIFRRLPPVTRNPQEIHSNQLRAASAFRRMGFVYVFGFVLLLSSWLSGEFKDWSTWGTLLLFCCSGCLISGCFWAAGRYKKATPEREAVPAQDARK
jgi:hypothetical protein